MRLRFARIIYTNPFCTFYSLLLIDLLSSLNLMKIRRKSSNAAFLSPRSNPPIKRKDSQKSYRYYMMRVWDSAQDAFLKNARSRGRPRSQRQMGAEPAQKGMPVCAALIRHSLRSPSELECNRQTKLWGSNQQPQLPVFTQLLQFEMKSRFSKYLSSDLLKLQ